MPSGIEYECTPVTVSAKRKRPAEPWLFPKPIVTMAQTRNYCGDYFEDLTAIVGRAERLATTGAAEYCPDLQRNEVTFFEAKSIGLTGSAILYANRLEKDARFSYGDRVCRMLFYWFWRHNLSVKMMRDVPTLRRRLGESIRCLVILPFPTVGDLANMRPLRMLNTGVAGKYGAESSSAGYGYSIPFPMLESACNHEQTIKGAIIDGRHLPPLRVKTIERFAWILE